MILEIQQFSGLTVPPFMRTLPLATVSLSLIWVTACRGLEGSDGAPLSAASIKADAREIAASYPGWGGPVDFQLRFGPTLCFIPPVEPRFSESAPGGPHAEKLYLVHAYDATSYAGVDYSSSSQGGMLFAEPALGESGPPVRQVQLPELSREWTQVLVKEAFVPALSSESERTKLSGFTGSVAPAEKDGESWVPGDPAGLFLMLRTARATSGTDEGWVYATVQPDGAVSEAGLIASCVDCHRRAGDDRMFGLPGLEHDPFVDD